MRQAVACAMDRQAIVNAIWRGQARLASTLLPVGHWAAANDAELAQYPHDPARAQSLLEEAGFPAGKDGVRLRLTMKTSTDETTRLMAAVLQQQMRAAGIRLEIRSAEFGTFYSDVTRGAFEIYALRWIGSNEDPDIFRYAYGSGVSAEGRQPRAVLECARRCVAGGRFGFNESSGEEGGLRRGAAYAGGGSAGDSAVVSEQ